MFCRSTRVTVTPCHRAANRRPTCSMKVPSPEPRSSRECGACLQHLARVSAMILVCNIQLLMRRRSRRDRTARGSSGSNESNHSGWTVRAKLRMPVISDASVDEAKSGALTGDVKHHHLGYQARAKRHCATAPPSRRCAHQLVHHKHDRRRRHIAIEAQHAPRSRERRWRQTECCLDRVENRTSTRVDSPQLDPSVWWCSGENLVRPGTNRLVDGRGHCAREHHVKSEIPNVPSHKLTRVRENHGFEVSKRNSLRF